MDIINFALSLIYAANDTTSLYFENFWILSFY